MKNSITSNRPRMGRGGHWVGLCTPLCILAAALVASRSATRSVSRRDSDGRVELLEETYSRAEKSMREANAKAHVFESKTDMQRRYAAQDQALKAGIIKMAQDEAYALRGDDAKAGKVEGIRERLDQALVATQQALSLHQARLRNLLDQVAHSNKDDDELAKQEKELRQSKHHMDQSLSALESKVGTMKVALKQEEEEAADPKQALQTKRWDRLVDLDLGRRAYAEKRVRMAHARQSRSLGKAKEKQAEALGLQRRADAITKQITDLCPPGKKACDFQKRKHLIQEQESLRKRVAEVEKEVLYHRREAHIMHRTEELQETQEKTDQYDVNKYRAKLQAAYLHLKNLKARMSEAPSEIKAAQLNVKLAKQSDERVGERLKILGDDRQTDEQIMAKDKALVRIEGRHLAKLRELQATQMRAVRTATRAVEAEDSVVHSKSSHIHTLMHKADNVQESADMHEQVAQRWTRAAMSELNEAKAYGEVAEQLIGAEKHSGEEERERREAKQMRHGLQLMVAKEALRRFRRDPTEENRMLLVRVRTQIMSRLGDSDDPQQNQIGIEETDEIQHTLNEYARARRRRPYRMYSREPYAQQGIQGYREDAGGRGREQSQESGGAGGLEGVQGAEMREESRLDQGPR